MQIEFNNEWLGVHGPERNAFCLGLRMQIQLREMQNKLLCNLKVNVPRVIA